MKTNVTALVLCGGKGERLRPLTESLPKPLVQVKGRAILSYLLDHIRKFGITDIVIAAGFKFEKIEEFFRTHHQGLGVKIVNSGDVDIIQRIRSCQAYLPADFILFYGDTLADVYAQRRAAMEAMSGWANGLRNIQQPNGGNAAWAAGLGNIAREAARAAAATRELNAAQAGWANGLNNVGRSANAINSG